MLKSARDAGVAYHRKMPFVFILLKVLWVHTLKQTFLMDLCVLGLGIEWMEGDCMTLIRRNFALDSMPLLVL